MKKYLMFFILCTACQHMTPTQLNSEPNRDIRSIEPPDNVQMLSQTQTKPTNTVKEQKPDIPYDHQRSYEDVVIEERPEVDVWIQYFTGRGKDNMKLYLERSTRYMDLMRSVLRESGLPDKLIYVAMIESGFSFKARSRAQAMGYWQFIEPTGRRYGLKVDQFIDERKDPLLSTKAASEYLKDLYSLFGSWYLAMASYNAGEYRVNRAMMKHYTRNFWRLRKNRSIPRETREYVPKFMAAYLIAKNPKKYGFHHLNYQKPIQFESVAVHQPISLKKLADNLSVKYKDLQILNPKYVTEYVPMEKTGTTVIRVPPGLSGKATQKVLTASVMSRPKYSKTYVYYKVRWGDSLFKLARRNRTTVNTIARMNGFSSRKMLRAGQVIKLPHRYASSSRKYASVKKSTKYHKVRRGESLGRIARRYGISASNIKAWNNLSSSVIHPRQVLLVKAPDSNSTNSKIHVVRRGDTLITIAKKYEVPLVALMKKNSLTFKSILRVGRKINIPE
ncbi:MAG: LysM peptidoglycan-binding domain-containing protein [Bdellovibrionales bacterium]|nr:LysM peptidoglycan-binding domain-containing protein [Bdellovibrionales bacterium]